MRRISYGTGILLVVVAIIYIIYAIKVFPIPGTDSPSFLPGALTFGQGKGLANPIYYLSSITDSTNTLRYNYYVPFYTWFLGWFVAAMPGIKTIFMVCALLTITALVLYRRFIIKNITTGGDRLLSAAILLSITYLATYSLPTVGRPEQLTAPLSLVLFLLYRNKEKLNVWIYNAILVTLFAIMLASQILSFYFAFVVLVIVDFLGKEDPKKLVMVNAARAVSVLLVFYFILEASPNGFMATITGISKHSKVIFSRTDTGLGLLTHYWVFSQLNFGFVAVFLVCSYYWYLYLRSTLPGVGTFNKLVVVCLHVALMAGMYKFIFKAAPTVYNATQYIYVILLFILLSYSKYKGKKGNTAAFATLTLTLLAGSLLFVRTLLLFIDTETDGKGYDAAKRRLAAVEDKYDNYYVHYNLWTLYDDPYTIHPQDRHTARPGEILVLPQANGNVPHDLAQYELLEDWRTTDVRTFMGIPLTHHPQGYSFVVVRVR